VHFLQIWIMPSANGLPSGYEQKHFSDDDKRGRLRLVASPDGAEGSVRVQQDARMYAGLLEKGAAVKHAFAPGRLGWLHVARGSVKLGQQTLSAGDGVAIEGEASLELSAADKGEVLLFDLPE
jgi:redox-sensitive bicupin YhaK (pirin superfamily)